MDHVPEPIPASEARLLGRAIVLESDLTHLTLRCSPADTIGKDGFGNLVKLPLGLHQRSRNTARYSLQITGGRFHGCSRTSLPIL